MDKKIENFLVEKSFVIKQRVIKTKDKDDKVSDELQYRMVGIYPSYDEAAFILVKARQIASDERFRREKKSKSSVSLPLFSIRKTDNPVTTQSVGKYINSSVYINARSKNGG